MAEADIQIPAGDIQAAQAVLAVNDNDNPQNENAVQPNQAQDPPVQQPQQNTPPVASTSSGSTNEELSLEVRTVLLLICI